MSQGGASVDMADLHVADEISDGSLQATRAQTDTANTPRPSISIPFHFDHSPALHPACSELEWMHLLNPKISTRNGSFTFYWGVAVKEFFIHMLHPLFTPFFYLWIRITKGREQAHLWSNNHMFNYPNLARPLFTPRNVFGNMLAFCFWFFYNVVIHLSAIIPMFLAFVRVRQISSSLDSSISQDYTHEAFFLMFFRAAWCACVGIKHGFYSAPLLKFMEKSVVDGDRIVSEQILMNWCPDLGRLMFELHVVTAHLPFHKSVCLRAQTKHPVVNYLARCKKVSDEPLCMLSPSSISSILQKLPENNFHKVFWTHPVALLKPLGHKQDRDDVEVESYSKYAGNIHISVSSVHTNETATGTIVLDPPAVRTDQPLNATASMGSTLSSTLASPSTGTIAHDVTADQLNSHIGHFKAECHDSKYVDVPAFILMAYAISRANNMGSAWIRPGIMNCRIRYIILFVTTVFYFIPGAMRVLQLPICNRINSCKSICGAFLCVGPPEYIGKQWGDIVLHIFWIIGAFWWLPTCLSFMCCCVFELFRRSKIVEAWADILRHGRDRSLSSGIELTSKEDVMNWYRLWEVIYRFRSKIKARLDAVAVILFSIPVGLLTALIAMLFSRTGTTPKFFVMCLYISALFLAVFVVSVHFGSYYNSSQEQELIMLSRLIAYAETLSSEACHAQGINLHAIQEICDGLSTVLSTVKTIHAFKPERIFFWLRADWTIVGSLGVGMFTLATIIYQQAQSEGGCRLIDGILDYARHTSNSTCISSPP